MISKNSEIFPPPDILNPQLSDVYKRDNNLQQLVYHSQDAVRDGLSKLQDANGAKRKKP